jgi:hypothetical protein
MREHAVSWLVAGALGAVLLIAATSTFGHHSDFLHGFWPGYSALQAGDFLGFRQHLAAEPTFMTLFGAPPAIVAGWLGYAEVGTARFVGVLPMLALVLFAGYLGAQARSAGKRWWPVVILLAFYPLAKDAIRYGHSEDLLAASAAIAAVLVALEDRPKLASALLVLAIVTKPWAVLAIGPAVLAAPRRQALIAGVGLAGAAVTAKLGELLIATSHGDGLGGLTSAGGLLYAQSLWWPLAPGPRIYPSEPLSHAVAPDWMGIAHPLIVALAVPLCVAWWLARRRSARPLEDAILLLALLFLVRCALDPWNNTYYHLPLLLTLIAWDVRHARFPWLALSVSACVLVSCEIVGTRTGWLAFGLYVAWAIPLAILLAKRVFGTPPGLRLARRDTALVAAAT